MRSQWAPQQKNGFSAKKIVPEARSAYHFSVMKKIKWVTCPCYFFKLWALQEKKNNGRTMGATPMKNKKTSWASQKKNLSAVPFFSKVFFFRAHDPGIPIWELILILWELIFSLYESTYGHWVSILSL